MTKYRLIERTTVRVDGLKQVSYVVQWKLGWLWRWEDKENPLGGCREVFSTQKEGIERVKELQHGWPRKDRVVYPEPETFAQQFDY